MFATLQPRQNDRRPQKHPCLLHDEQASSVLVHTQGLLRCLLRKHESFSYKVSQGARHLMEGIPLSRVFLAFTGALYLYLAIWCSIRPAETSRLVGFQLQPGSGQSEFLTVYGGLEFGLALVLLWPLVDRTMTRRILVCCFLIHASLVAFRTLGFILYTDIQAMTWKLAAGEWALFLVSGTLLVLGRDRGAKDSDGVPA